MKSYRVSKLADTLIARGESSRILEAITTNTPIVVEMSIIIPVEVVET